MRVASLAFLVLVLAACASSPEGNQATDNPNVISQEQIDASNETTLFDVVDRYHPEWLQDPRLLIVDDDLERLGMGNIGGIELLKRRGTEGVFELEYLNAIRARSVIRNMAGARAAIIVRTRPGGSR